MFLTEDLPVPVWLIALTVLVIAGLITVIWSLKRRRSPRFKMIQSSSMAELGPSLAGVTNAEIVAGNSIALFENGAFFDELIATIAAARRSVHFETFLWKDGSLGTRLADALCERAQAELPVRVIVDAQGGKDLGEQTVERLKNAGCHFAWCHPYRLPRIGRFNRRDHRKIAIVDGRIAFVGGHCIVDTWLGNAEDRKHFRDVTLRVEGPIVHAIQSTFSENWIASTGELLIGEHAFPELERAGATEIHIARSRPGETSSDNKVLHHVAIASAKQRILIQNPYFLPDPDTIELFATAVERGVDVRVMTPSPEASDMPIVQRAARHNYSRLLAAGVRLFEYRKTLLHQKLMSIDGCWTSIGSSNFDDRSFEINDEITLGVFDETLAATVEAIFERDLDACDEVDSDSLASRGLVTRTIDASIYAFNEQL